MTSKTIKPLPNSIMEEYIIKLPEKGGNEIRVSDHKSGLVVRFISKNPILVEHMGEDDFKEIVHHTFDILQWWTTFDGDQLINLDEDQDDYT